MDTLHTVLNRGASTWDRSRIGPSEFEGRLARIRAGMREHNLDLLLVYGDSWKFGNLSFVSHFMPKNRGALAVIPADGPPALVVQEPDRNNPFSRTLTWIEEVYSTGQFAAGLDRVLGPRGLAPKLVGLVSVREQLGIRQWNALTGKLGNTEPVDCTAWFEALRREKSATELKLIEATARVLVESMGALRGEARPGRKEYEMMASAERAARRKGVEDFRFLVANAKEPGVGLRPAGDAVLEKGAVLLVVVAASQQRYWAELGQTLSVGAAAPGSVKGHELARALFEGLQQGTRAGVDPSALAAVAGETIPATAARDSALGYGLGNGLGLDLIEAPLLGVREQPALAERMVVTLRACIHTADAGSGLISRPFEVTSQGLRPLVELNTGVLATG